MGKLGSEHLEQAKPYKITSTEDDSHGDDDEGGGGNDGNGDVSSHNGDVYCHMMRTPFHGIPNSL